MLDELWMLPGAEAFVRRTADALADGNSIVVGFPEARQRGFVAALAEVLERGCLSWQELDASTCGAEERWDATEWLAERLLRPTEPRTIAQIVGREAPAAVLVVQGITLSTLEDWLGFLQEYQHLRRNQEQRGSVFLLITEGVPRQHLRARDAAIQTQEWRGALSRLDVLMLAAQDQSGRGELERSIHVEVVCELARFDPDLAVLLLETPLEELWDPVNVLRSYAEGRGWNPGSAPGLSWENGAEDLWGGVSTRHSSVLVLSDRADLLSRRVWRALVRVVFPALEEERLRLLEEYRHRISLPVETSFGTVTEHGDLELADMAKAPVVWALPQDVARYVKTLKNIRHRLAHLEVAALDEVRILWKEHSRHTSRYT